jgi:O-antigen/teichoic acid export membrane protein
MTTGAAGVQLIGLAASPIIARVFDPKAFGGYAIFTETAATLAVVACLSYEKALPLPKEDEDGRKLFLLCLLMIIVWSALLFGVVSTLGTTLFSALGAHAVVEYSWLLPILVFSLALNQAIASYLVREGRFDAIVRGRLFQSFGQYGCQVLGGYFSGGHLFAMLGGNLLGNGLFMVQQMRRLTRSLRNQLRLSSFRDLLSIAWRYKNFPLFSSWSRFLDLLSVSFPLFVVSSLHGAEEAGYFRMACVLTTLPISALSSSISSVYWNKAASETHGRIEALRRRHINLTLWLSGLAVLVYALIWLLPLIIPLVFGEKWVMAGTLAKIVAVSAMLGLITTPLDNLSVLGFNHWEAWWISTRIAALGLGAAVCHRYESPLLITVGMLVAIYCLFYLALFWLNRKAIAHRCRSEENGSASKD